MSIPAQEPIRPADALREPEAISEPDIRNWPANELAHDALRTHHANVAQFSLAAHVPHAVAVQFETAKNLYLYAWHVYRFFPVAESHALATLEFGLRDCLTTKYPQHSEKKTLAPLLRLAVKNGLIRNEGFRRWHENGRQRAISRESIERINLMMAQGLKSMEVDEADVVVKAEDMNWNLVDVLINSLPKHRNLHAHGGPHLYPFVLGTFELVHEILNQIYSESA